MNIKYDCKQETILKILSLLPSSSKAIRTCGTSIIIPTSKGARQVYKGDTIIIDGENITIIEK
jgi:hypothetical protein